MKTKLLALAFIVAAIIMGVYLNTKETPNENPSAETDRQQKKGQIYQTKSSDTRKSGAGKSSNNQQDLLAEEYEKAIDKLLGNDYISNDEAARQLLSIAANPRATIQIRVDALEHALNLTDTKDFRKVSKTLSSQEAIIPEPILQTLFDESYNRDHMSQVDTAFEIISGDYGGEITEEAIDLLEFHTDQEHGDDIAAWQQAVENYRKQNADETPTEE